MLSWESFKKVGYVVWLSEYKCFKLKNKQWNIFNIWCNRRENNDFYLFTCCLYKRFHCWIYKVEIEFNFRGWKLALVITSALPILAITIAFIGFSASWRE